jgi:type VI secretion system secreted protein VgrG
MSNYRQDDRWIKIETPLGKDVLLLEEFRGIESVSYLFKFHLTMSSEQHNISFQEILGQKATITITLPDGKERYFNGIIDSFKQGGTYVLKGGVSPTVLTHYYATLSPSLWLLTLTTDCRIFQNLSVPEILEKIFLQHRLAKFDLRLHGSYKPHEYCVQYRETDFAFVSRLMEEEGIFYFFEHDQSSHQLVLSDNYSEFRVCPLQPRINYRSLIGDDESRAVISDWAYAQEVRSGRYELRDFNFRQPSLDLAMRINGSDSRQYEIYDFPGEYKSKAEGERYVSIRMEEENARQTSVAGTSNSAGLVSGHRFDLEEHYRADINSSYMLMSVEHHAKQDSYRSAGVEADQEPLYENRVTCLPYPTAYRPPRITPVPFIHGSQTAVVVGPEGEEIYVDKYGRIKVQFHWDREGNRDEKSSCWIRVSQPWAGKNWGAISIPRIGQEVIVDFLEGDPDQPIITGRVYNGEAKPPYTLPENKTHSGVMSRSSPGGGPSNFNGMRMNDSTSGEMLSIQAEKDEEILVKNDKSEKVGNNETIEIGNDRTETVGNNEKITIGANRTEDVGKNETISIGKNRNITVSKNEVATVALTRTHSVGINEMINIGAAQEISVGGIRLVTVGISQIVTVGLKHKLSAGSQIELESKKIILKATEELTLKCGAGIITIDAAGNITIKGPQVKINC